MSTLKVNTLLANDGNPATPPSIPGLENRMTSAWVSWDSFTTGVPVIRDSFNVSSLVDEGVGDTTVNFATNLPTVNFSTAGLSWSSRTMSISSQTVSSIRIATINTADVPADSFINNVVCFSN